MSARSLKHPSLVRGAITIEYIIVSILVMLPIWYFVVGGSGSWLDTDRAANPGNLTRTDLASEVYSQSAINVLHERQHDFADAINQP